jgi:hypothetical protein
MVGQLGASLREQRVAVGILAVSLDGLRKGIDPTVAKCSWNRSDTHFPYCVSALITSLLGLSDHFVVRSLPR